MATPRRARRPLLATTDRPGPARASPPRKPMAMTRRISLFEREIHTRLAPIAVDLLHAAARVITEGELVGDDYAGSTMLTVDLARTRDKVSDPPDASTAQRVASLYATDERCRDHARRIASKEARRIAGCELTVPTVDVDSRARGPEIHLSLDVEAHRERRAPGPATPPARQEPSR